MKIGGKRMQTDLIVCLVLIMKCSSRTLASNEKADSLSSLFPHSDRVVVPDEEVEEGEKIDKRPDQQAPSPKIPQQPQSEKVTMEAAREKISWRIHDIFNVSDSESVEWFGERLCKRY